MSALVNPRSPRAQTLHAQLDYQCAVNSILLASTRPASRLPKTPLLSEDEMDEMDLAFAMGVSPEDFAARLVARDQQRGAA